MLVIFPFRAAQHLQTVLAGENLVSTQPTPPHTVTIFVSFCEAVYLGWNRKGDRTLKLLGYRPSHACPTIIRIQSLGRCCSATTPSQSLRGCHHPTRIQSLGGLYAFVFCRPTTWIQLLGGCLIFVLLPDEINCWADFWNELFVLPPHELNHWGDCYLSFCFATLRLNRW